MARYLQGFEEFTGDRLFDLAIVGISMADKKAKEEKKEEAKGDDKKLAAKKGDAPAAEGEGAPAEGAEGEEAAGGRFGGKKKIIIIAGGVVLLLIAGGAGAYFTGVLDKALGKKPDCAKIKEGDKEAEAACAGKAGGEAMNPVGVFIDVPDLIVNLSNATSKQQHFLKIALKIELEKKEDEKPFTEALPRVIDQFQTYLRELRMEDLRGSGGLYRMKIELLTRVRAAAPGIKVRDVLFQEILVQ
jgi:flagellar FliL protein